MGRKKDLIKKDLVKKDLIKKDLIKHNHPLVEYSFDEFYEKPSLLDRKLEEYYKDAIALTFSISPQTIGTAFNVTSKTYEVIFSPETQRKLDNKIFEHLGSGRAIAVNKRGRIVEHARIKPYSNVIGNLINIATTTAYIISAADTQMKLTEIAHKIDKLIDIVEADRIGELRGLYNNLKVELSREKTDATELKAISNELRILSGRFFETAKVKIKHIKDPTKKRIIEKLRITGKEIDNELNDGIRTVFDDLKAMQVCHMLDTFVNHELEDNVAKALTNSIIVNQLLTIKDAFSEKIEYIDPELAKKVHKSISSLNLQLYEVEPNVLIKVGNKEYKILQGE